MSVGDLLLLVAQDALWAALASTGFAMLFNVPRRALPGCAIAGATGHAMRTLLMQRLGVEIEIATLVGATIIGFMGVWMAWRWKMPSAVFTISASIALVPGSFAFRTMMGLLELAVSDPSVGGALLVEVSINAIKTGLILGAIAVGIALPALLFVRQKPVV
jgi:uncharacterized membrane protein YjjB (DUF3815 family)